MTEPHLSPEELAEIRESFDQFDSDKNGHITTSEIGEVMKALGESIPGYKIRDIIKEVDLNENGTVEFNEFLEIYKKNSKKFSAGTEFKKLIKKTEKVEISGGTSESSAEGTKHTFSEAEKVAFVDWINTALQDDAEAKAYLPMDPATQDLFVKINDGIILCKMINLSVPDTVDERAINKPKGGNLTIFKIHENMTLALNSARSIGCNIVNIGAEDLEKGKPHLVLGLLWQIIRVSDSECYSVLLRQITPPEVFVDNRPMSEKDHNKRAEKMLQMADRIGCRKFVRPKVRSFRNWMNSIGVNPYVNNLYRDLCNGLVLLQLYDIVKPGSVNWDKVNRPPFKQMGGKMKKIENCNYAVEIGRTFKFSLVGIGGQDIHDCNETLTLAVVWQQMRSYTLALLSKLTGDGKKIEDKDIVEWVNDKLKAANKTSSIASFQDPTISTSLAVLDLVDAIKAGIVEYDMVSAGETDEEKHENAKYALSVARKIGATTYALPDDLVEVKPKMVLTVFACLMATALALK
ncbi:plastin-3-like [Stylophora pistillata]|uniref:plastin-3-like n=1 Tax=Stylophora pistillata TaxID=50429 RepID=UPI000C041462|nr:plastin-3-like [Stylophora pistillata]